MIADQSAEVLGEREALFGGSPSGASSLVEWSVTCAGRPMTRAVCTGGGCVASPYRSYPQATKTHLSPFVPPARALGAPPPAPTRGQLRPRPNGRRPTASARRCLRGHGRGTCTRLGATSGQLSSKAMAVSGATVPMTSLLAEDRIVLGGQDESPVVRPRPRAVRRVTGAAASRAGAGPRGLTQPDTSRCQTMVRLGAWRLRRWPCPPRR